MRSLFTLLLALVAFAAQAQYLPNSSFDSWKSSCGSTDAVSSMIQRPGVEPGEWNGSSVNQLGQKKQLVFNEGNSVKLQNMWVGFLGIGSTAPGYITLGTPWVYASMTLSDCDGGTYGGVSFNNKPDAITGRFKRTDSNSEDSYIIAYLWRGEFRSNIGKKSSPDQSRSNVERAVLGMNSGAPVGKLIAKCNKSFSSTGGDWQTITVPIEYLNDETPEMMNVIICGGDYWDRGKLVNNTTLYVDDVQFVYYSELASLIYDGKNYFASGKSSYRIEAEYDASKLSVSSNGKGAVIEKSYNESSKVLTIKVKGNDYAANNSNVHTYTIEFTDNGGVVEPEPEPNPDGTVDYTPVFTGAKTKGGRWITNVTMVSGKYADETSNSFVVDNSALLCYNDYTAAVKMKAAPGEIVTLAINEDDATSWMNAYVYIDADNNGFKASIAEGSNWQPAGDLVSYSFYNNNDPYDTDGWNSVGTAISGDARSTVDMPAFAVPSEAGVYRVRVKLDWCNIDPAGDQDGKFGDFMDNGGQIVDFMLEVVSDEVVEPDPDPTPEPDPEPSDVDYTPTNTGTRTYTERDIDAVVFTSPLFGVVAYELEATERASEYLDLTGEEICFVAAPGEQVAIRIETGGSWVNHYVYIDYDADGFTASIADGSNYQPAEDLVAYSFYNNGGSSDESGWNSKGVSITGDDRSMPAIPEFAAPSETGTYRMRIKQDWCSIDPAGDSNPDFSGTFSNYGGQIIDVVLVVANETGINEVKGQNGNVKTIYDLQGRKVDNPTKGIYIINGKKVLVK